jgi:hypothetical protein
VETCEECGFELDERRALEAGPEIVEGAVRLAQLLNSPTPDFVSRREADTWSPLEYACHLRDVLIVQRERMLLGLREDRPAPPMMGSEDRVIRDGYAEQQPSDVARQLTDSARLLANVMARISEPDWNRQVRYVGYHPEERSLRWVAVDTWHEMRHHSLDIERQL